MDESEPSAPARRIRLRYDGACRSCGLALSAGTEADYHPGVKQLSCRSCGAEGAGGDEDAAGSQPAQTGRAGGSARREHQRRTTRRETITRDRHPRLGGLILAMTDEPQTTKAWERGAVGEEKVGRVLDDLVGPDVQVLHDRRIPGSRANLDHLAIAPGGVFVIDAKRYTGRPQLKVEGGLLRPRTEKLLVGRRDCTRLVTGVLKQVGLVRAVLESAGLAMPVQGVLCFVDADWPLFGGTFNTQGTHVTRPKKLAELLGGGGVVSDDWRTGAFNLLAHSFPPAS
jgi:hypothetical protein